MASAKEYRNKNNELTEFRIKVSRGYDANGKQLTPYSMVWKLPKDWYKWDKKRQQKELDIAKANFQAACDRSEVKTKEEIKAEKLEIARLQAKKEAGKIIFSMPLNYISAKPKKEYEHHNRHKNHDETSSDDVRK